MTKTILKISIAVFCGVIHAQIPSGDEMVALHTKDSFHIHIPSALHRKSADGKMMLTIAWSLYRKPFLEEEGGYGNWIPQDLRKLNLLYGVYCARDSEFIDVVSAGTTSAHFFTLKDLKFGERYFYRVDILDRGVFSRTDVAQATVYDIPPELSPWQSPWRFWKWLWVGIAFVFAGLWLITLGVLLIRISETKKSNQEKKENGSTQTKKEEL